jgi:hypothetical protein
MGRLHPLPALAIALLACADPLEKEHRELEALIGNWKSFDARLRLVQGKDERDIVLLSLAVENPRHAPDLCKRTEGKGAKEKCRQVIGRPHLGTAR